MSDPRNLRTYATGDGITDDSPAVNACIDYCIANNATMEVPPGRYRLNSLINKNISGSPVKIGIIGAGPESTEFIIPSTNTQGAFSFDVSNTTNIQDRGLFRDFSIRVEGNSGIGLRFKQRITPRSLLDSNSVVADNIRIYSFNVPYGTAHVDTAFDFSGTWRPILNKLCWYGPIGVGSGAFQNQFTSNHPALSCNEGIKLHQCYDPVITSCWIKGSKRAIDLTDVASGNQSEAVKINDCLLNQCNYGIYWERSTREPLLMIHNTHINYRIHGIHLEGARQFQITNCLIYNEDDGSGYAGVPRDIYLADAEDFVIANNIFSFPNSNPDRIGIQVADTTGPRGRGIISNNVFNGRFWWMIFLNGAVIDVAGHNMFTGTFRSGGGRVTGGNTNINLPDIRLVN